MPKRFKPNQLECTARPPSHKQFGHA